MVLGVNLCLAFFATAVALDSCNDIHQCPSEEVEIPELAGPSLMQKASHMGSQSPTPLGLLPGATPLSADGKVRLYLMFGAKYPPYSYWNSSLGHPDSISGIGVDVAKEVCKQCDLDCVTVVDEWPNCWDDVKPGKGLESGWYHACATYTNQYQRQWSLEFSHSILKANKPAGLLARLGEDGKPVIPPSSDLSGFKICDVKAWAPTIKSLAYSKNSCTNDTLFKGYEVVLPEEDGPDASMKLLLAGKCDAVYMYADMVESRKPEACNGCRWDADLYSHLGTKYSWIHTGVTEHMANGTTLTLSKKGSGVPDLVNPCIAKALKTKVYFDACKKYNLVSECYPNEYFPEQIHYEPYVLKDSERTKLCSAGQESAGIHQHCGCETGYCGCSATGSLSEQDQVTISDSGDGTSLGRSAGAAPAVCRRLLAACAVLGLTWGW